MSNAAMQEIIQIPINATDAEMRLDAYLASELKEFSRSQVGKLIKAGLVTIDGESVKPSQTILLGQVVFIKKPQIVAVGIAPQPIELDILYSDEHLAVINKQAGLTVHPGAGAKDNTLCNALLYHFPDMVINNAERPGIVHRLDKETSGIMVVAKTHNAHLALSDDFKHRRVKKIYRAYCFGEIESGKFELKTGHVRHPFNRLKFLTKIPPPLVQPSNVRLAHTDIEVLAKNYGLSEIRATLHTGRTHQIRAHLSDIDYPLLGDELYGGKRVLPKSVPIGLQKAVESLKGQALHAESLEFTHPIKNVRLHMTAPLPEPLLSISKYF